MKKLKRYKGKALANILLLLAGIAVGYFAGHSGIFGSKDKSADSVTSAEESSKEQVWICSMHPQIRQPEFGQCPICFMDLILEDSDSEPAEPGEIVFSENSLKLMELRTAKVQRKSVETKIRMVGKIGLDETRIKHITAWASGRLERLFVDFTGTEVIAGDHMVQLYSPELINAQAEFVQAAKSLKELKNDASVILTSSVESNYKSARGKLKLLGITDNQIDDIEKRGKADDYITIYAPSGGVVIDKHLNEGAYVKTGTEIYTIADMSKLWVMLDAYESDMPWVRYGQNVEFTTESYPGTVFNGTVSFISPVVDSKTRSIKVRVNVDNVDNILKPDMLVSAMIRANVASEGKVMAPELAGKWICPMHPSVIKEEAGICDICEMDLVTTESLGYFTSDAMEKLPLVIPATAPLITGKRAVVYVKVPGREKPTYAGKEVVLGSRAGDYYLVKEGVDEGEEVVVNGNFKIDSALQIQADYSMMNPPEPDESETLNSQGIQTHCPVMGNPINKDIFVEYKGKKVYFCCDGCDDMFLKDPEKYLDKLPQFKNSEVEGSDIEQKICPVMGNPIDKNIFIEYKGKKVYFCCPGCDKIFNENPEKYLDKLPQFKNDN